MLYPLSYGGHGHQCAASTAAAARTAESRRFRPRARQTEPSSSDHRERPPCHPSRPRWACSPPPSFSFDCCRNRRALWRTGLPDGVSALAALNATVSAATWTLYGIIAQLPIVWVVSLVALGLSGWTAVLLRRSTTLRDIAHASVFVAIVIIAGAAGLLALALAGSVLFSIGPQLVKALRETDLAGIAPATMWLALGDAAAWGAYGALLRDPALVGYFLVLTASAAIILFRLAVVAERVSSTA